MNAKIETLSQPASQLSLLGLLALNFDPYTEIERSEPEPIQLDRDAIMLECWEAARKVTHSRGFRWVCDDPEDFACAVLDRVAHRLGEYDAARGTVISWVWSHARAVRKTLTTADKRLAITYCDPRGGDSWDPWAASISTAAAGDAFACPEAVLLVDERVQSASPEDFAPELTPEQERIAGMYPGILDLLGHVIDADVGEVYGVSRQYISRIRRRLGISAATA